MGLRGQIPLPSVIRRKIGLQEGDQIAVVPQGDRVILRLIALGDPGQNPGNFQHAGPGSSGW